MNKIVIARGVCGFILSDKAKRWLYSKGIINKYPNLDWLDDDVFKLIPRHSKLLIECVETLGKESWFDYKDYRWVMKEYDHHIDDKEEYIKTKEDSRKLEVMDLGDDKLYTVEQNYCGSEYYITESNLIDSSIDQ